jgi:tricarballylate dehydrogenase
VGAGNAALTAAVSAAGKAAKVAVLEKATMKERGGNTRFTGGVFRVAHSGKLDIMRIVDDLAKEEWENIEIEQFPPETMYREIMKITQGKADPKLIRIMADKSYETVLWMKENVGVKWILNNIFQPSDFGVRKYRGGAVIKVSNEGIGLSDYLFSKVQTMPDATVLYDTKATKLLTDDGRVTGIRVWSGSSSRDILTGAIVLGSGGFEANPRLRAKFMGKVWERARVRGTRYNTGEMLMAALEIGAQPYGDWSNCHASPIDERSPDYGDLALRDQTARYSWMYGILVNKYGKRFVDEGQDFGDLVYAKLGKMILHQPRSIAFQIFDQKVLNLLEKRYQTMSPITSSSFKDLERKIQVNTKTLENEVETYNGSVDPNVAFDPSIKDGRSARIQPPKTNWAQKIDSAPYVVYPVTCGITFTFGGLRIDERARVIGNDDNPIRGLYAAGETTGGFFYDNYPAGSGLLRGAVFGRIAGEEAAQVSC